MARLQKTKTGQYFLTIPLSLVKAKRWKKGEELLLILNNRGNIEIQEIK